MGAEPCAAGGVHFRVWAPHATTVAVVWETPIDGERDEKDDALSPEGNGYFSGCAPSARVGMRYRFRLDSGARTFPDPASRWQPLGPHGPSQVEDPNVFSWTDGHWPGIGISGQVLYEMHVGTFTKGGTWTAAAEQLPRLAALGITAIELMPVAEFSGQFGWGYDGVDLFAPSHLYGTPDDLRRFVDRAHALGIGVLLDVVYNHLGPDGNYLGAFASEYFSHRYQNEWGEAINFDDEGSGPVRELMASNARYWIDEFHLDGLRVDATQQIFDASPDHIIAQIAREARAAAGGRAIVLIAENEPQDARIIRPAEAGGYGLDALWNDDFHHSAMVALTGRREAYYTDYLGSPQELLSLAKHGFLYQGQRYSWQKQRRGAAALDIEPARFVTFLQNHDQVANTISGRGDRLHQLASPAAFRAMTAFWLLAPGTPMLFQGQEFSSSSPFLYFADHQGELARGVREGRAGFMSQFPSAAARSLDDLPDPSARDTYEQCVLQEEEWKRDTPAVRLHRDLLRLRREDAAFRAQRRCAIDGAVLDGHAFVLRFSLDRMQDALPSSTVSSGEGDCLVVVNLGSDLHLRTAPEPLLAPPAGRRWAVLWSSEDPAYGGAGTPPLDTEDGWKIPGLATVVLKGEPV